MQPPLIGSAQALEGSIDEPAEPVLPHVVAQQFRAHHRRQRQRDEAGDDDGPGKGEGELAKERAGDAGDEADRRIDRGERDRHRDDRQRDLVRAADRGVEGRHALLDMAIDVLDHDDRIIDDEADAEHEREKGQQVDRIAERKQRDHHADQRQRNGDDRDEGRAKIAEKEENHDDHDRRRLDQGLRDLVDRRADELGRVIGDRRVEAARQLALDARHDRAHAVDHGEGIGFRRAVDADEHGLEPVEDGGRVRALGPEFDARDVAEAHQRVAVRGDHQLAEGLGAVERGQRVDADLGIVAFDLAGGGGEVVGGERGAHVIGRHAVRGHPRRIEPDAHGEHLTAQDLGIGDAVDRLQARLHDAGQIIGDLRGGHHVRIEREIHEGEALARLLDDDGIVGLARQEAAHLVDLGERVGHRPVGIGVEPEVEGDRRHILLRGRDQGVDALAARDRLLDRRGDEALDHVGGGAGISGRDGDRRVRRLRKLADLQLVPRHAADEQDEQADDRRQHRPADEEVGEGVHLSAITVSASRAAAAGRSCCRW